MTTRTTVDRTALPSGSADGRAQVATVVLIAIAASLSACFLFEHDTARLQAPPEAPAEVRAGCRLAESRCTRCHTIDRILNARVDSPMHWRAYVHRMRLQPQSGILPDEEPAILKCLVYRSFGSDGLAALPPDEPRP